MEDLSEEPDGAASARGPETSQAVREMLGRGSLYTLVWATQLLAGILTTPITTRALGEAAFGRYALSFSFVQLFIALTGLGLQTGVQRLYVEDDGRRRALQLLANAVVLTTVVSIALEATGRFWGPGLGLGSFGTLGELTVVLGGSGGLCNVGLAHLRSQDRLRSFAAVSLIQSAGAQVLGIASVFMFGRTASNFLAGMVVAQLFALILCFGLTRPDIRGLREWRMTLGVLKYTVPMVPQLLASYVLNTGDRVVVQHDLGSIAVARYQIAYNVGSFAILLLGVVNQSWAPRFLAIKDADTRWAVLRQLRDRVQLLLGPLIVGVVLVAPVGLRILAPARYKPDRLLTIVALVACSALPYAFYIASVRVLIWFKRTILLSAATAAGAIVNIGLNILLVPHMGIEGSALATLICYGISATATSFVARRFVTLGRGSLGALVMVPATGVAAAIAVVLPTSPIWLILRVVAALGCLFYLVVLIRQVFRPTASQGLHIPTPVHVVNGDTEPVQPVASDD